MEKVAAASDHANGFLSSEAIEYIRAQKVNGYLPLYQFGEIGQASIYLTQSIGLLSLIEEAQHDDEYANLNDEIRAAAVGGVRSLIEMANFCIEESWNEGRRESEKREVANDRRS
jgi:hypothetical protein